MSVKRQATTELNHENWDQEDPPDQNEIGTFKAASKDILEKRVIRKAKRRSQFTSEEPKESVFSGFGGFNKTQPKSFDFLANLTNGSKNTNGSTNSEASVSSSLFTNKPTSASGGLFSTPATTTPVKSTLGTTFTSTSPFGAAVKTSPTTLFTASKADSTVNESPFKIQPVSSSVDSNTSKFPTSSTPQSISNVFGVSSSSANINKTLVPSVNSSPFKLQPVSSTTTTMVQTSFGATTKPAISSVTPEKKDEDKPNDKKMKYYSKLKGLNESVSDWVSKHVAQTPLCILTPIFSDYEKYLKEITDEYQGTDTEETDKKGPAVKTDNGSGTNTAPGSSLFSNSISNAMSKPSVFGAQVTESGDNKTATFSFGIKPLPNSTSSTTTTNTGFSFGVTTSTETSISPFSNTTTTQNTTAPFSFGVNKPFSFSPNSVQQSSEQTKTENDEDEPPKVEYTPVKEDNSVFEKKCKIFVKKDGNFADKGVGTLYVKKIEESGKHQLLVRANTNLATVLLNLVLASAVPTQRMGKNNVMLVCIPTPDAQPPPTPVLIRVKTAEEADELLETLNKYKG